MGASIYCKWMESVRRNPDRIAVQVVPGEVQKTFRELSVSIEKNIESGNFESWKNRVVAIQFFNSVDWLEAFLTCQAAGAISMPIEPDVPETGFEKICSTVRPCAVWTKKGIRPFRDSSILKPACLIKLTSGSTGDPRPLIFEDEQMLADGENIISSMGIREDDINLAAIPFGHSYGLGNLIMPLLMQGTSLAVPADPFPSTLIETIDRTKATLFPGVPALLDVLNRAEGAKEKVSSVRLFLSAGSPLGPVLAQQFYDRFARRIHNFYGSSETGGIAFDRTGEDSLSGRSAGIPLENVNLEISPTGRLLVSSLAVYRRYNPLREATGAACLLPDQVKKLPDGSIVLIGRKSRQIKIDGKRLNLAEIEKVVLALHGVEAAYVSYFTENRGRARTRLVCVLVSSAELPAIKDALREKLSGWKIPSRWIQVSSFPLTSRGKLDTKAMGGLIRQRLMRPEGL